MRMPTAIILFVCSVLLLSCRDKPMESGELYEMYRSSVVLIQNSYYFKTTLDNGFEFYYTFDDHEPVFHDTEEEAIENAGTFYGTGFFISSEGEVVTNRHVVYPEIETRLMDKKINEYFNMIRDNIRAKIVETENEKGKLAEFYNTYSDDLNFDSKIELRDAYTKKENEILEMNTDLKDLEFNSDQTSTELKTIFLGIAYDDTHVTSSEDFSECVALKKSAVEDVDLALIQLKNKTTPEHVRRVISLEESNKHPLKLNDQVYMIGFNHGISLAKTNNGIKSQFTQGQVTQDPDSYRILYSIPTLPGSSGSPVINQWGQLVAVNFAKVYDSQSFSFGIPVAALKNFCNVENIASPTKVFGFKPPKPSPGQTPKPSPDEPPKPSSDQTVSKEMPKEIDFSNQIRRFIEAEDKRDFDLIYSFFSPSMSKYYDIQNPTYTKLKEKYEYVWGITSYASNDIQQIVKINDYVYDMKTSYSYFHNRKQENFQVESTVRFMFNEEGKLIELYSQK